MPLLFIKAVGETGKIGLWHITETLNQLHALKSFSPHDHERLKIASHEHRKKEMLVARIVTEKLMGKWAEIIYDEYNKPFVKHSKKHISVSHSHNLLAVIMDEKRTGIDIELVNSDIARIQHRFMNDSELKWIKNKYQAEILTLCWCAKEALYKLYGKKQLSFKKNILIDPFKYSGKGIIHATIQLDSRKNKYKLFYEKIPEPANNTEKRKDYILAYITYEDL